MSIQKFKQYSDYKVMSQFASHLPTTESSSVYTLDLRKIKKIK